MDINGGAEKTAWDLHRAFRARGHESYLAVGIKRSDDPHTIELGSAWFRRAPVRSVLSGEALGLQGVAHPASKRMRELVGAEWDIAHLHNLHGRYFDLSAVPGLARSAPVILTLHDMWLLTGHCAHSFSCDRWRTGCGHCPDLSIYPSALLDFTRRNLKRKQRYFPASDILVTSPGRWLLDLVESSYLGHLPRMHMPNTVDTTVFSPGDQQAARATLGLPRDVPIMMFPSRLMATPSPFKGQTMFLEVARRLAPDGVLGIAFGDESSLIGHSGPVRILPQTFDEHTLANAYQAADVIMVPSQAETSGIVLLEAMACARPVVTTTVGGIPEIVKDGVSGDTLRPSDLEGFVAACRRLLASSDLRSQYGAAGTLAASSHELATVADRWLSLYSSLVKERATWA